MKNSVSPFKEQLGVTQHHKLLRRVSIRRLWKRKSSRGHHDRPRTIHYVSPRRVNLLENQFHLFSNDSWDHQEGLTNFHQIIDFYPPRRRSVLGRCEGGERRQLINQSVSGWFGVNPLATVATSAFSRSSRFTSLLLIDGLSAKKKIKQTKNTAVSLYIGASRTNRIDISANEVQMNDTGDGYRFLHLHFLSLSFRLLQSPSPVCLSSVHMINKYITSINQVRAPDTNVSNSASSTNRKPPLFFLLPTIPVPRWLCSH